LPDFNILESKELNELRIPLTVDITNSLRDSSSVFVVRLSANANNRFQAFVPLPKAPYKALKSPDFNKAVCIASCALV